MSVELPDSTTVGVTNAHARFECHRPSHHRRQHNGVAPASASVGNELTAIPVPLEIGNKTASCAVEQRGHRLASFTCYDVSYPSDSTARFESPNPLMVGHYDVTVLEPSRLCIPDGNAEGATNSELLCFDVQMTDQSTRHRHHRDPRSGLLWVPSTDTTAVPGPGSTASSTTSTSVSTTTTSTSTTTTTTPTSQPCAGTIIDGVCVIEG